MFIGDSECAFMRAALHIQRWRPNGWTDRGPNWYKHSLAIGTSYCSKREKEREGQEYMIGTWRRSRRELEAPSAQRGAKQGSCKLLNLIKYMNGTWRRSRREHECAVHAGRVARSMDSVEQKRKKKVAESQADILW
jgi:hypothetical protein